MGSSTTPRVGASPAFLEAFRTRAGAGGALSFADFVDLALYHPVVGYYRRNAPRVGYGAGTDFYTASTSGPIFGELIVAACVSLLGPNSAAEYTFVEIGAETAAGVLAEVKHPFSRVITRRVGEPLDLRGRCIVFSNELFDAQPFRRFVGRAGQWRERGVGVSDGALVEIEFSGADSIPQFLPPDVPEGYVIDAPTGSVALLEQIVAEPWTGLFVAC